MSIDFKGYKYAVVTIQGGVLHLTDLASKARQMLIKFDKAHTVIPNPDHKEEKQMDSIYTQEMFEAGEIVISEMTAMYKGKKVLIRLGCDDLRNVVFRFEGAWITVNVGEIKPIDTRTDKEKAIDDLVSELTRTNFDANMNDMDLTSIVNVAFEAGLTFTEKQNEPCNETK